MVSVKNKLSSCFHPFAADVEHRLHSMPPPSTSSDAAESHRESKTAHHTLSGFVKAVFFRNTLLKKIRSKRWNRDTYYRTGSNTSASKTKRAAKKNKKTQSRNSNKPISDPEEFSRNNSNRSSLFSSSSSSSIASSISSNSSSGSDRVKSAPSDHLPGSSASIKKHALNLVNRSSRGDCGGLLFIVLVCLVALVFWGKFFAIVTCTSAWLFLAPGRRAKPFGGRIEGSEEHNKRVIMEGLLGRNVVRSRVVVERDL